MKISYIIPEEYFVIEMGKPQMIFLKKSNPFVVEQGFNDTLFREKYGDYKQHGHFPQENWAVQKAIELEDKRNNL